MARPKQPGKPANQVNPDKPGQPGEPGNTVDPANTANPSQPVGIPSQPEVTRPNPANTVNPAQPGKPVTTRGNTDNPSKPVTQETRTTRGNPSQPGQPVTTRGNTDNPSKPKYIPSTKDLPIPRPGTVEREPKQWPPPILSIPAKMNTIGGGRPSKDIDLNTVRSLCKVGCPQQVIADSFGISLNQLREKVWRIPLDTQDNPQDKRIKTRDIGFSEVYAADYAKGGIGLFGTLYKKAIGGHYQSMRYALETRYPDTMVVKQKTDVQHAGVLGLSVGALDEVLGISFDAKPVLERSADTLLDSGDDSGDTD